MSSHDLHIACLFDAIRNLNHEAVPVLLQLFQLDINDNSSYDEYYGTAMHVAAETNNEPMIRLIASLGGKVDSIDYYGNTPLFESMKNNRVESIRVLLEIGADLYTRVDYFNRETNQIYFETPLSVNMIQNNGKPYSFVVPYTKEKKRLKKLQWYTRVVGKMILHYHRSLENVWKPEGVGYHLAKMDFQQHLIMVA